MEQIGFLSHLSIYPTATWESRHTIRRKYPNNPIFYSIDGECQDNYISYPTQFTYNNIEWLFNRNRLGYPPYTKEKALEWLKRTYIGVLKLNTEYTVLWEDDCILLNHIRIQPNSGLFHHNITHGNKIPISILDNITINNGFNSYPGTDYYAAGGGTIFKTESFCRGYYHAIKFLDENWEFYEKEYSPQIGYSDCFLTLYFMILGIKCTPNPRLYNLDPHNLEQSHLIKNALINELAKIYEKDYDILHGCKKYY